MQRCTAALLPGKHSWCVVSAIWAAAGMVAEKVDLMPLLRKRASLIGSTLRSRSLDFKAALVHSLTEDFQVELKQGSIKPPVDKVYPLGERGRRTRPHGRQPPLRQNSAQYEGHMNCIL